MTPLQVYASIPEHLLSDETVEAFLFAYAGHHGQYREFAAEPYLYHPVRVASAVARMEGATSQHVAAALLHDVVEDTPYNLADLRFGGKISDTVIDMVVALTKTGDETYAEFLDRIMRNPDARMVKWCDVLDNISTLPFGEPRMKKYLAALHTLSGGTNV